MLNFMTGVCTAESVTMCRTVLGKTAGSQSDKRHLKQLYPLLHVSCRGGQQGLVEGA